MMGVDAENAACGRVCVADAVETLSAHDSLHVLERKSGRDS